MKRIFWFIERTKCAFLGHAWGFKHSGYRCIKCNKEIEVEE